MKPGHEWTPELQAALLDAMVKQTHVGVAVCDAQGALAMISPALEQALGAGYCTASEPAWAGHYYFHDEQGRPLPSGADPLARALHGEHLTDELVSIRRPRQPVRWLMATAFPLRGWEDQLIGAAAFVVDVTARTTERRRLDTLRDQLIETVNHEVRTPIATITGHLELIEPEVPALPKSIQWSLGAMNRAAARLREVVATISELADRSQARRDQASVDGP